MNKFVRCLLFVLTLLAVVPGFATTYVAVMRTRDKSYVLEDGVTAILTDKLRERAMNMLPTYSGFAIMTEDQIRVMLPPDKDIAECINEECLVETGRNVSADYVAQADVVKIGNRLSISARMFDTKNGNLVGTFMGVAGDAMGLLDEIEKKADGMFSAIAGGNMGMNAGGGADGFEGVNMGGSGFKLEGSQSYILKVSSEPSGAMVVVDGRAKCKQTPCNVELPSGEHRFSFSLDRYIDKDTIFAVDRGELSLMAALLPNFGVLDVSPKLVSGVGEVGDLAVTIDGKTVSDEVLRLSPGSYEVAVNHRCYEPVLFTVKVKSGSNIKFDEELVPLIGGLKLSATEDDAPKSLPVYVNGLKVGDTPLLKEIVVCAKVEIGENRETVPVTLKAMETVEYTHSVSTVFLGSSFKGTMKDLRDGQAYKIVSIGSQTWMAENLNYKVKPGKQSWCYDNKEANCKKYGRLYTWAAAVGKSEEQCGKGKVCNQIGRVQGVCPAGWHLPSNGEWETLVKAVGGKEYAGKRLKSTSDWNDGGNGADSFGFAVLPAGGRGNNGGFYFEGVGVFFWSSTENDRDYAYHYFFDRLYSSKNDGLSVRCLLDSNEGDDAISSSLQAWSSSSSSKVISSVRESNVVKGIMKDPRDGRKYKTVTIGKQTWMAENLNYKVNPGKQSWCNYNKDVNCKKYGRLYTWAAAVGKSEEQCGNGKNCNLSDRVQGVCPVGWHLPNDEEWKTLWTTVGGKEVAGKRLKSTSGWTSGWIYSGNGLDEFNFSVLPAGLRIGYGDFFGPGSDACFWSSTEDDSDAYYWDFRYDYDYVRHGDSAKDDGFSVRCLRN